MTDSPKTTLFVYGSLKRGQRNHALLADQRFLADATTEPRYRLVSLGTYPGLVRDETNGLAIRGELWEIDARTLAVLDAFEVSPEEYCREPIAVPGFAGPVDAYFWQRAVPLDAVSGAEWPFPG